MEAAYWRENYKAKPHAANASFDDYGPAYGYGVSSCTKYARQKFDDIETDLARDWNTASGKSKLKWNNACVASRDAWDRISDKGERAIPGDSDHDGN